MWPVTQQYLDAIGTWRGITSRVSIFDPVAGGEPVVLTAKDGGVTVDGSAGCRRTLALTLPPDEAIADKLAGPGVELTVTQTVRYIDRSTETVPLGVFQCDADDLDYNRAGDLTVTGRDRWVQVQRSGYGNPYYTISGTDDIVQPGVNYGLPSNTLAEEILRQVEGAWPPAYPFPGWAETDLSYNGRVNVTIMADGDREAAIRKLCDAASLEVFFNPEGKGVLRKKRVAYPDMPPDWVVVGGEGGALLGAKRSRDRSGFFNAVRVESTAPNLFLGQAVAAVTDPADPLSIYGRWGFRPYTLTSPAFSLYEQMDAAAMVGLMRRLGRVSKLDVTTGINAALEADDVISAQPSTYGPAELRVAESFTVPLSPSGVQMHQTRAVLPTGYEATLKELGF